MEIDDDWIENRIRFKAGKHKLPSGITQFFDSFDASARETISHQLNDSHGIPVLVAYDSPERWAVITTRHFVGFADAQLLTCAHSNINAITSRDYPPADWRERGIPHSELGSLKGQWEYLRITTNDNATLDYWVPPGGEAFAFWNILLMLSRMAA